MREAHPLPAPPPTPDPTQSTRNRAHCQLNHTSRSRPPHIPSEAGGEDVEGATHRAQHPPLPPPPRHELSAPAPPSCSQLRNGHGRSHTRHHRQPLLAHNPTMRPRCPHATVKSPPQTRSSIATSWPPSHCPAPAPAPVPIDPAVCCLWLCFHLTCTRPRRCAQLGLAVHQSERAHPLYLYPCE